MFRKGKPLYAFRIIFIIGLFITLRVITINYSGLQIPLSIRTDSEILTEEMDSEIIQKTRRFAERNADEEDVELVEFVKNLIVPPFPDTLKNLTDKVRALWLFSCQFMNFFSIRVFVYYNIIFTLFKTVSRK